MEDSKPPALPPLLETFPPDKYALRDIGTGYSAQDVHGPEADAAADTAAAFIMEGRDTANSKGSHDGVVEDELFNVEDLPPVEGAAEGGVMILRNERIFPGMVGMVLPRRGILWLREDGTINGSGFFRKQIPRFEMGAIMAVCVKLPEFLDVYHALFRPVIEFAAPRHKFGDLRVILEAGLRAYPTDCHARQAILDVRQRLKTIRGKSRDSTDRMNSWSISSSREEPPQGCLTNEAGSTATADALLEGRGGEGSGGGDSRAGSGAKSERAHEIAKEVLSKDIKPRSGPFRLWKGSFGKASYDRDTAS